MNKRMAALATACSIALFAALSNAPTLAALGRAQGSARWVCPPCGGECDSAVREEPGGCSRCGMQLVPESSVPSVAILLYEGVDLLSFAGPAGVLSASRTTRIFTVADSTDPMPTQVLGQVVPMRSFAETPPPDVLIIPSGRGAMDVAEDELVMNWVASSVQQAEHVLAVGSGGLVLAKTGLLEGQEMTVHPALVPYMAEAAEGVHVHGDRALVTSGKFWTARETGSSMDAALGLVRVLADEEAARKTAERLGLPWQTSESGDR